MRLIAAWTVAVILLLCVLITAPVPLWPLIVLVSLYAWSQIPAWLIQRQMTRELKDVLNGRR